VGDGYVSGWLLVNAPGLSLNNWYMMPALKDVKPTDRIGNVFVYHGRFYLPKYASSVLRRRAERLLDEKDGDKVLAEKYYLRAAELNPESTSSLVELGNFAAERGEREKALNWYERAWKSSDDDQDVQADIRRQIDLLKESASGKVTPMRNPSLE
jgi:tetratricopeptide (TPR) repeat protein